MCELLGICTSKKIQINDYLRHLSEHSHNHPDGWGLAVSGYEKPVKEPVPAYESQLLEKIISEPIEAQNAIGHIRLATRGNLILENCHPFYGTDVSQRNWTLAHNGTIFESAVLDKYTGHQIGSTDSERILLHLLHKANELNENSGHLLDDGERFQMIDELILEIVPHNKLNLMIYDGEILYVHTNMKNTLYYREIDNGIVFGTTPMDDEPALWKPLQMMQLLAFSNGKYIKEGTKHQWEYTQV